MQYRYSSRDDCGNIRCTACGRVGVVGPDALCDDCARVDADMDHRADLIVSDWEDEE
jgi:hypothetical protein